MEYTCSFEGCTFAETGVCSATGGGVPCEHATKIVPEAASQMDGSQLGDHEDVRSSAASEPGDIDLDKAGNERREEPGVFQGIYSGEELGTSELRELMSERPSRLIAILGEEKSGKTGFLVCLYLMIMSGDMEEAGYLFVNSRTLPGFETRANASRIWPEDKPSSLSVRTTNQSREAGFMHLDLKEVDTGLRHRLLMSDIPGEWTDKLIGSTSASEPLAFVRRSDHILLLIDGHKLHGAARNREVERNRLLLDRLAKAIEASNVPMLIMATYEDEMHDTDLPGLEQIAEEARHLGFSVGTRRICTYSVTSMHMGHGVADVLQHILKTSSLATTGRVTSKPARIFGWSAAMRAAAESIEA
ncbi:TRAFAC clade GTPase domain-containing protein [Croceicoccus mobilis]|uniref:Double-GTPase 2 domain-containing protein n=1 Tax=Croceicoccus mobilis TaxID=1703339 RepID=A0A916Z4U5_9SPHN|nr:hypothetical protein [Croceicoccus mobilis]GGD76847.1 hypothetical protein GCM10010990_28190 [Croceicoccus mobilis]